MNKQDLIAKVADVTGMQKSDSEKAVNAVFDQITDVLKARGEVRLVGFGTFKTSIRLGVIGIWAKPTLNSLACIWEVKIMPNIIRA